MAQGQRRVQRPVRRRPRTRKPPGVVDPLETHRQRAVAAMLEVAGRRGYAATTVRDLLVYSGMSRRTFYSVFDNREDCFIAAYNEARRLVAEHIAQLHAQHVSSPALLELALRELLAVAAARPALARILIVEPASVGPLAIELHERTMREFAQRLAGVLNGGAGAANSPLRFEAGVGAVERVVRARIVGGRTKQLPGLAPELAGMLRDLAAAGTP
jgi:AcrR family transcriptional regulator